MTARPATALLDALIASVAETLTPDQTRFLLLHARASDPPVKWVWHFGSTMLRAYTDKGATATIGREAFDALVRAGLMKRGPGCSDAIITDKGRRACK